MIIELLIFSKTFKKSLKNNITNIITQKHLSIVIIVKDHHCLIYNLIWY